jgi:hypothetical protein
MFLVWIQDERIPCWHCLRVSRSAVSRDVLGATIQHATAPQILKQLASNGTAGCCDCEGDSSHQTQRAKGLDVCLCTSPRWELHCVILVAQHYWPAAAEEFQLTSIVCVCADAWACDQMPLSTISHPEGNPSKQMVPNKRKEGEISKSREASRVWGISSY